MYLLDTSYFLFKKKNAIRRIAISTLIQIKFTKTQLSAQNYQQQKY